MHKHNGKDLLECVQIDPNNLKRFLDEEGHPRIFVAHPSKTKIVGVLDKDENGKAIIPLRLDV